ncbi:MAG: hypothetical protein ACD_5C00228G0003 [uncultured bacterium]|nr:MAG: hypothetical protein ACD_5C00228G0003 [uncultured bacterium]
MTRNLTTIEESDYYEKINSPFFSYVIGTVSERKAVSRDILIRTPEDILLIDEFGFGIDSIFAGINESQIEYFAKHAPLEYKKEIIEILSDENMMNGVWEIVKSMDEDEGDNYTVNQDRINKVIRYIQDNQVAFKS